MRSLERPIPFRHLDLFVLVCASCIFSSGCGESTRTKGESRGSAASKVDRAGAEQGGVRFESEGQLREALIERPDDPSVLLAAVDFEMRNKANVQTAATYLDRFPEKDRRASIARESILKVALVSDPADRLTEDLIWKLAEQAIRKRPKNFELRNQLVDRLKRRGFLHRAHQHCLWLCQANVATKEQLFGLIDRRKPTPLENGVASSERDQSERDQGEQLRPDQVLAHCRRSIQTQELDTAIDRLDAFLQKHGWDNPAHAALSIDLLARAQRFERIPDCIRSCPDSSANYPSYWSALGVYFRFTDKHELACRCLLQAITLDPTQPSDFTRLSSSLERAGQGDASRKASGYSKELKMTHAAADMSLRAVTNREAYEKDLAKRLFELGRPMESLRWQVLSAGSLRNSRQLVFQQRQLLADSSLKKRLQPRYLFGLQDERWDAPERQELIAGLPSPATEEKRSLSDVDSMPLEELQFVDVANDVGVSFQYQNSAPDSVMIYFRLHETLGGGIAVLDYDHDGRCDLYLGQASGDPAIGSGNQSNQLFRNIGDRFVEDTLSGGLLDHGYTTGLAAGDWNQDGFSDLAIGSFDRNRLLLNQGDGTFLESDVLDSVEEHRFTSSLAIADVNGDHRPDLVELNYVDDASVLKRPIQRPGGMPDGLSPLKYTAAADRVFQSDVQGQVSVKDLETESEGPVYSLGLVIAPMNDKAGNEIFIAADVTPNRMWTIGEDASSEEASSHFIEAGRVCGVALDQEGVATAGMGIAASDFDGNGLLDLHVTNFFAQPSSLFLQQSPGVFADQSARFGLVKPTHPMLGFGSQPIDVDHDAAIDLAILNGHIEDYSAIASPFQMKPQMLVNDQTGFRETNWSDKAEYWQRPALGRSLVTMDWNRDGRMDLVASHLDHPVSMLENRTKQRGNVLRVRLIGTVSERDAIGARLTLKTGGRSQTEWRIAGNGYLASNEPVIDFGLGNTDIVDELQIRWPSGSVQLLQAIAVNQQITIFERDDNGASGALSKAGYWKDVDFNR